MMKEVLITMGLPLSGKTTWINENYHPCPLIVSADKIKEELPDYSPDEAHKVHQQSIELAEQEIYKYTKHERPFIVDSGSINNSYTVRIINHLKDKGYRVNLVHIKTPYEICLERNKQRERKVPESNIIHKAIRENAQFNRLKELVDSAKVVDYWLNDHIFVDMDGVIASLSTLPIINGEIDFVNGQVHKYLPPVKPIIDKLFSLKSAGKKLYILSAIPNSFSYNEKNEWLNKHFDIPKENRFFVNQGKHKAEMLDNLSTYLKLEKRSITLIDDIHSTLYEVKARGMNCMHVSEFLIHNF